MPKPLNKHAMIDIETLGRRPGCPVLSIGVVWFDPECNGWKPRHKGFYVKFDFQEVVDICRDGLDPATIAWWMQQSDDARKELVSSEGTTELVPGLQAMAQFLTHHSEDKDLRDVYVWGNSNLFDLGILQYLYDHFGLDVPWHYARDMNVRTVVWMAKTFFGIERPAMSGTAHNALDDARHQAEYVTQMVQTMVGGPAHVDDSGAATDGDRVYSRDPGWGGTDS